MLNLYCRETVKAAAVKFESWDFLRDKFGFKCDETSKTEDNEKGSLQKAKTTRIFELSRKYPMFNDKSMPSFLGSLKDGGMKRTSDDG
jgi:hypothetical protein